MAKQTVADFLRSEKTDRPRDMGEAIAGYASEAQSTAVSTPTVFEVSWLCDPKDCEVIDGMIRVSRLVVARSPEHAIRNACVRVRVE